MGAENERTWEELMAMSRALLGELACARLAVSDWHACSTPEELERWRAAIQRLIDAAKAVERGLPL
jgi:hypothetical protein